MLRSAQHSRIANYQNAMATFVVAKLKHEEISGVEIEAPLQGLMNSRITLESIVQSTVLFSADAAAVLHYLQPLLGPGLTPSNLQKYL
jgi:hypothetical protein